MTTLPIALLSLSAKMCKCFYVQPSVSKTVRNTVIGVLLKVNDVRLDGWFNARCCTSPGKSGDRVNPGTVYLLRFDCRLIGILSPKLPNIDRE